jgi:hypothetical protein
MVVIWPTGKTNDEITGKLRTKWDKRGLIPRHPAQDLSNKVNPEVTEEVVHHAGMWVNGCLHFYLHSCKVIHPLLESSNHLRRVFPQLIVQRIRGSSSSIPTLSSKFTSYTKVWPISHWQRESYLSISSVLRMEMSSLSMAIGMSSCTR